MATNKILPWAQTGTANVLSDDAYAADVATGGLYGDGVKTGQASSQQANKTWRQATAPGSGLGQFLVDNLGVDVTDADTPSTFSSRIANAILKLAQISPFNQSWAVATGGYRKYAIVSDSSGNYWSSTADQNVTVPGSTGANWQSLFNGYATQAWANGQFLQLVDAETQTVTGPVAFSGATTVPSVTAFAGTDALNAETAEGRYIKSIPVSPNKRITDIWENADGRTVAGDGSGSNVLASLSDLPLADPSRKIQAFIANVSFSNGPGNIVFPTAFATGEVPIVVLPNVQEYGGYKLQAVINIQQDGDGAPLVTNTGVTLYGMGWANGDFHPLVTSNTIPVIAIGKM